MTNIVSFVAMADMPNRLYELRRARGLSQQALADLAHCSKMHISGVERGTREFSLDLMRRFARVFGVSPADLLNHDDNPGRLRLDEQLLLETYRRASPEQQAQLQRVAEAIVPYQPMSSDQAA